MRPTAGTCKACQNSSCPRRQAAAGSQAMDQRRAIKIPSATQPTTVNRATRRPSRCLARSVNGLDGRPDADLSLADDVSA